MTDNTMPCIREDMVGDKALGLDSRTAGHLIMLCMIFAPQPDGTYIASGRCHGYAYVRAAGLKHRSSRLSYAAQVS